LLDEMENEKTISNLKHIRSDRTLHMSVGEGASYVLGEMVKDVPEFVKIHVFVFAEGQ
jgi:hypothetical protein